MFLRFGFGKGGVGVGGGYKDKESKAWEPKFSHLNKKQISPGQGGGRLIQNGQFKGKNN